MIEMQEERLRMREHVMNEVSHIIEIVVISSYQASHVMYVMLVSDISG